MYVVLKNSKIHLFVKNASAMRSSFEGLFSRRKSAAKVKSGALIRQIKQDSEQEFSRLYHVHVQELFNYGMHVCDDPEFVKSCLRELFVHVCDHRDLCEVASIKAYLFGSFRKLLIGKIHTRRFTVRVTNFSRPQVEFKPLTNDDVFADHEVSPFNNEEIIHKLTGRQAEAVFLKFYNLFSYHEVASIMDLKVATIYSLVSGTVETLRQQRRQNSWQTCWRD
jgi:DNA-directed RNA polymerase specialized sigma24 family protein